MQDQRYSRQIRVPQIGLQGQERLSQAKVVVVGAGGLGCVVSPLLVGAGVGTLLIVDHDEVSLSNLHRQTLYRESDIGQSKALVSASSLVSLNSGVSVEGLVERCHPDNVRSLVEGADVVIDAADNFAVSYLLNDACEALETVLISASVNRTYGYVGAFCGPPSMTLASLRDVFPLVPDQQTSCDIVGVTGPAVAAIGAVQAQEVLKYLVSQTIVSTLWQFELWDYAVHGINVARPDHSENRYSPPIPFITQNSVGSALVVDVRELDEIQAQPLPVNKVLALPLSQFNAGTILPKNEKLVFACRSGQRALIAAQRALAHELATADQLAILLPTQ